MALFGSLFSKLFGRKAAPPGDDTPAVEAETTAPLTGGPQPIPSGSQQAQPVGDEPMPTNPIAAAAAAAAPPAEETARVAVAEDAAVAAPAEPELEPVTAAPAAVEPPGPPAEELCGIDPETMDRDAIRRHLAELYRRHNAAAGSLNTELRAEAEQMLDAIVTCRDRYIDPS